MNRRERQELDRHITGNYGEDQMKDEIDYDDLLAQCDELLAALVKCVSEMNLHASRPNFWNGIEEALDIAQALIEKYKGA